MVRRWSYLNNLNRDTFRRLPEPSFRLLPSYRIRLFSNITYYVQQLFSEEMTKFTRKSFFRLRHLTNFWPYYNIIISWSKEYSTLRRVYRLVYKYRWYRYSYILLSSIVGFSRFENTFSSYTNFAISNFSRSLDQFFRNFPFSPYFFLNNIQTYSLIIASSLDLSEPREDTLYLDSSCSLYGPNIIDYRGVKSYYDFFDQLLLQNIQILLALYKTFILQVISSSLRLK